MGIKLNNNAGSLLAATINTTDTTISVTAGEGALFPVLGVGEYFYATLQDVNNNIEIVKVTARSTDAMTIVRAQEGTTAVAWAGGDIFEQRLTAATFVEYTAEVVSTTTATALALKVDKTSSTGSAALPTGTTAERDGTPSAGYTRFNSTTGSAEIYDGTAWGAVGGGATGGTGNAAFYLNDQTITADYTIPVGQNAGTFGQISIATGVTVTVPTDSTWSII